MLLAFGIHCEWIGQVMKRIPDLETLSWSWLLTIDYRHLFSCMNYRPMRNIEHCLVPLFFELCDFFLFPAYFDDMIICFRRTGGG